jgi:hypothetical protein
MPLTRHFYEIDEVVAALQWCLQKRALQQALFWLWELVVSCEEETAAIIINYPGSPNLDWPTRFVHATAKGKKNTTVALALWDYWNKQIGRRKARVYTIPVEALNATTTRGRLPAIYTNIDDIRNPVVLLPEGCSFWKEISIKIGLTVDADTGTAHYPNDDVLEAFYEQYFPDDIPDEWSTADQEKSHGTGQEPKHDTMIDTLTAGIKKLTVA